MSYEQIADLAELTPEIKDIYCRYMRARWEKNEEVQCKVGYAREWAERFKGGIDYARRCSDKGGQIILDQLLRKEPAK